MRFIIVSFLVLGFGFKTWAGSSQVILKCQSPSGRTQIDGWVPGDESVFNLDFTIDKQTLNYNSTYVNDPKSSEIFNRNAYITVVDQLSSPYKVYTLAVLSHEGDDQVLSLYMLPESLKIINNNPNDFSAQFKARVRGVDPRHTANDKYDYWLENEIDVNCTYIYKI